MSNPIDNKVAAAVACMKTIFEERNARVDRHMDRLATIVHELEVRTEEGKNHIEALAKEVEIALVKLDDNLNRRIKDLEEQMDRLEKRVGKLQELMDSQKKTSYVYFHVHLSHGYKLIWFKGS